MEQFSFVFTVFFMLLGPIKIIPAFSSLTRGTDARFKRDLALRGALIASALNAFVAMSGVSLLDKYHISINAIRISGGLVLLIAALLNIFQQASTPSAGVGTTPTLHLAASPVAVPIIIQPAGIAAILIFMMMTPQYPGIDQAVAICLVIVMLLDLIVMYFIDQIMKMPGLMIILTSLGSVLVFMQVGLAVQMILGAMKSLGMVNF
jgi:multiple antibiotic resistance protein